VFVSEEFRATVIVVTYGANCAYAYQSAEWHRKLMWLIPLCSGDPDVLKCMSKACRLAEEVEVVETCPEGLGRAG